MLNTKYETKTTEKPDTHLMI